MFVRSVSVLAILGSLSVPVAVVPALAQSAVTPSQVLAAKKPTRGARVFDDRTARITSIMGPELSTTAPLRLPTKPEWQRAHRREASAGAEAR